MRRVGLVVVLVLGMSGAGCGGHVRDVVIRTPNATEPVFARLVPSGLFYAFNVAYAKRPGRLAFVTRSALDRALASRAQAN